MADLCAFLEEFEAPMWADLNFEAKATDLDTDDDWFKRSHHFHQCSSRQLRSTVFHPDKGSKAANSNIQKKLSSPKVPSSVSRSRGKDYRSREWREAFMLDNRHPVKNLNAKSSSFKSGSSDTATLRSSITSLKGNSIAKTRMVNQTSSSLSSKANEIKPASAYGYSGSSNSIVDNTVEAKSGSIVTSESIQQEQPEKAKVSDFLMVMRASLRKSYTTRQATRVKVKDTGRQRDSKSLPGKSSVGSSSYPGSYGRTSTARSIQKKEGTPESRHFSRMTQAAKNKISVKADKRDVNSEGSKIIGKKSTNLGVTKSKVQNDKLHPRVPLNVKVGEQKSVSASNAAVKLKEKSGSGKLKGLADNKKDNARGKMVVSQKCSGGVAAAGTMATSQRESKQNLKQRSDKTGWLQGKIREVVRGNNLLNQRLYFR